jgi:hypothetical protein
VTSPLLGSIAIKVEPPSVVSVIVTVSVFVFEFVFVFVCVRELADKPEERQQMHMLVAALLEAVEKPGML